MNLSVNQWNYWPMQRLLHVNRRILSRVELGWGWCRTQILRDFGVSLFLRRTVSIQTSFKTDQSKLYQKKLITESKLQLDRL